MEYTETPSANALYGLLTQERGFRRAEVDTLRVQVRELTDRLDTIDGADR